MQADRILRHARRRAGLTQRALAKSAAVPQPTVARLERGHVVPRLDTLDRLLRACSVTLEPAPRLGEGVDRTAIRELLRLTPRERARIAVEEARALARLPVAER